MQDCLDHPEKWWRDPLIYRFGHRQPLTTIGCREYKSPSMHAVFYLQPDGAREAWIHFDLHGPRDLVGHSLEVMRNRLTLGHTSQSDVYRSFVRQTGDTGAASPPTNYDYRTNLDRYVSRTFAPHNFITAAFSSAAVSAIHRGDAWGRGPERYLNHFEGKVVRHSIRETIEFGAAALLHQEQTFVPSTSDRMGARTRSAVYHAFFVPERNGDELAFPRVAAAFGTGMMVSHWHPWMRKEPSPGLIAGMILSKYVGESLWREFRPDVKRAVRKGRDRLTHADRIP